MKALSRLYFSLGALLMAAGVGAGAYAAHGLEKRVEADMVANFETGATYHLIHAGAILFLGFLLTRRPSRAVASAGVLFLAGILFFSGNLYIYALTGAPAFARLVPVGGICFMAGWVALAFAPLPGERATAG